MRVHVLVGTILASLFFGPTVGVSQRTVGEWKLIFSGVWYAEGSAESPRLQRAYALRVDLHEPDVAFMATPPNGSDPGDTAIQTTPDFLGEHGLVAAINANFYRWAPGGNAIVEGLLVSNGVVVSDGDAEGLVRRGQLRISSDNRARITDWATAPPPTDVHTGIAGGAFPLLSGSPLGDDSELHPRTGVGVSEDERYLIMLVIDGRQPGYSNGATIRDIGVWLKEFGAWHGVDLDGGGSSTLVTAGEGIRNRPSDGLPRAVGANFGVFSKSLEVEPPERARLEYRRNGDRLTLTWSDPDAQLQTATEVHGPWSAVNGATSPHRVDVSTKKRQFFRLCFEGCLSDQ